MKAIEFDAWLSKWIENDKWLTMQLSWIEEAEEKWDNRNFYCAVHVCANESTMVMWQLSTTGGTAQPVVTATPFSHAVDLIAI